MKRIIFPLAAIALGGPAIGQDEKPISETCPNLTAEEIEEIENYKGQFSENAWYARSQCVSVEEAERRKLIKLKKDERSGTYMVTGFSPR